MINWEDEFKRSLVKRFKELTGLEISVDDIMTFPMDIELDLTEMSYRDLGRVYAFAIMKEDYEQAQLVKDELIKRDARIELSIDEPNKKATIDIYVQPVTTVKSIEIKMKILPEGMMIDFDEENIL